MFKLKAEWEPLWFSYIWDETESHDFPSGAPVKTDAIPAQFKQVSLPLDSFTRARSQGDEHQKGNKMAPLKNPSI